jgi:hypothetical protein
LPRNLKLSDSEGILNNVSVSGSGYTPPSTIAYNLVGNKTVTWTLSGENVGSLELKSYSYYKSFYGKKVTSSDAPITVTQVDILASTVTNIVATDKEIKFTANTSNTEQGWIAVPKVQSNGEYTSWEVDYTNSSSISVGEFITPPVEVSVNGVVYYVYRWGYRSPLNLLLTLKK